MRRIKHTVDELLSELRDFYTTQEGHLPTVNGVNVSVSML
jgi:hypothetical protein